MFIYLTIFFFAIILSCISQRTKKPLSILTYMIAALPMIIVAGCRDIEIGSDTCAYPLQVYDDRFYYSFNVLSSIEPLYSFLGYFTYLIKGDFSTLLLITHILIIGCFFCGFWRLRKEVPLWMSTFLFCFLFYNTSLQISRQSIALGVVFLGFSYLKERKLLIYIISVLIGFLFHKSALAALFIIPFIYLKEKIALQQFILFGVVASLVLFSYFLSSLVAFQMFDKYEAYAEGGNFEGKLSYSELLLRILFIYYLLVGAKLKFSSPQVLMFLTEFFLNLLQIRSRFLGRTGYYMYILYFWYIPFNLSNKIRSKNYILCRFFIFTFVFFYWWYVYIEKNAGHTYPYTSKILGISYI